MVVPGALVVVGTVLVIAEANVVVEVVWGAGGERPGRPLSHSSLLL